MVWSTTLKCLDGMKYHKSKTNAQLFKGYMISKETFSANKCVQIVLRQAQRTLSPMTI